MTANNERIADLDFDTDGDATEVASKTACVAIVWVEVSDSRLRRKASLLETVTRQHGVSSARYCMEKPMLIIVDYVPGQIRGSDIVEIINGPGVRARLVGC